MTIKILVMGLPGAGKTFLSTFLKDELEKLNRTVEWFNADEVRKIHDDWDFSEEGRIRQSSRMRELAEKSTADFVICDFVAPLIEMRINYAADVTIWMDTIDSSRFEDTNRIFSPPTEYDYRIMNKSGERWAITIADKLNWKYPNKTQKWYHKIFRKQK